MTKKIIISLLLLVVFLSSCSTISNQTNHDQSNNFNNTDIETTNIIETITDTTSISTSELTTSSNDTQIIDKEHYVWSQINQRMSNEFFESLTRIYYLNKYDKYQYYNKLDGETYPLCFDPLCEHGLGCITLIFSGCPGIYSQLDNRIYCSRGDCIYSMDFNGSDLKLEIAFSDKGKNLNDIKDNASNIDNLAFYDNYLFFLLPEYNEDLGKYNNSLYRYNISTKEFKNISNKEPNLLIRTYCLSEYGNIYVIGVNEDSYSLYCYDLNFENKEIIPIMPDANHMYNTTQKLYTVVQEDYVYYADKNKYYPTNNYISCVDFKDNSITKITDNYAIPNYTIMYKSKGEIVILYADNDYVYYSICDDFVVHTHINKYEKEQYTLNSNHTIYKCTISNLKNEIVFEGLKSNNPYIQSYEVYSLYKFNSNLYFSGHILKGDPDKYKQYVPFKRYTNKISFDDNGQIIFEIPEFDNK